MSERAQKALLWTARIGTVLFMLMVLLIFVVPGEDAGADSDFRPTPQEWPDYVGLALFPFGVGAGMAIGWKWHRAGGWITLGCLVAFYVFYLVVRTEVSFNIWYAVLASPGLLNLWLSFVEEREGAR